MAKSIVVEDIRHLPRVLDPKVLDVLSREVGNVSRDLSSLGLEPTKKKAKEDDTSTKGK